MGALYASLIKTILILILFYAAPGLFVVTELSEYFDCGASSNDLICTTIVIIFIVVFVLLMRIFVFPIYNKIETIRNNS